MRVFLTILLSGILTACGAESRNGISAEDIRESILTGEDAAKARPPHGFALYPHAQVEFTMLGGMMMTVRTSATERDLTQFYSAELERLGWTRISTSRGKNGSMMLEGRSAERPYEFMAVLIGASEPQDGSATLGFIKGKEKN